MKLIIIHAFLYFILTEAVYIPAALKTLGVGRQVNSNFAILFMNKYYLFKEVTR